MNSVLIANTAVTAKPAKLQVDYSWLTVTNEDLSDHNKISLIVKFNEGDEPIVNRFIKIVHQILCVDNEFESLSDLFFTNLGKSYMLARGVYFHNLSLIPEIMHLDESKLTDLIKNSDSVADFEIKHSNTSLSWKIHVSN